MPSNSPYVCVPCRQVQRQNSVCTQCHTGMIGKHSSWRAPKRNNDRAWKLIEQGQWLWDAKLLRKLPLYWTNERARRKFDFRKKSRVEMP